MDPEVKLADGSTVEDMTKAVRAIEGLFHAINAATFPLRCYDDTMMGMQFLKAVHDTLIKQLGPDEVERIRKAEAFKANAPMMAETKGN